MFGAVVATAMGVLFLYVVPSLRDDLVTDRLDRLERVARLQQGAPGLTRAMASGKHLRRPLVRTQKLANATVTGYLDVSGGQGTPIEFAPPILPLSSPLAEAALRSGVARGRTANGGVVVAFTVKGGLLFLSQGLSDVNAAAALVERQILLAALVAMAVAVVVGWGAALAISVRLERLKEAASRVAAGTFDQPIGDESPDEVGQVARSFDLMQARLAQVDRARKDFIANASHELRTPLFSLGGSGKIVMLGSMPVGEAGDLLLQKLVNHYSQEANITMRSDVSEGTIVAPRQGDGFTVWFVINMDGKGGSVTLPQQGIDLQSNSVIEPGKLEIGKFEYKMIQFN